MDTPKSRFALKLQELGFEKVVGANKKSCVQSVINHAELTQGKLSRHDRRKLRNVCEKMLKEQPSYTVTVFRDGVTITEASDDTGQMWKAKGSVYLGSFGFLNNAEWLVKYAASKKSTLN